MLQTVRRSQRDTLAAGDGSASSAEPLRGIQSLPQGGRDFSNAIQSPKRLRGHPGVICVYSLRRGILYPAQMGLIAA